MASRALTYRVLAPLRLAPSTRQAPTVLRLGGRPYSTSTDAPPPLLQKLKGDLKTAMREKDASRLSVLRAILAATLNASKTANPIRTDVQLVALLRKTQRASLESAKEFKEAGREDLATKEEEQAGIMEEYLAGSGVQALGPEELKKLVSEAIEAAKGAGVAPKAIVGDVMKRLATSLEGKDVDRKELANIVRQMAEA
ncbi:related to Altered inheritance of mitochondria protein 41, mitochondrial [Cephalotrichum gorgonifer]|uniref:Altered inheritance of mitochondria protein 41 n=1 Tax=Cephalotrichum gorgonifer TaxID=2041049 RepID=A0AAE8N4M3_9PEZI|nr:related to Altered inheritance of mitochondria protein 41, mitochondrial [Cephalotrichum gorgonifer]